MSKIDAYRDVIAQTERMREYAHGSDVVDDIQTYCKNRITEEIAARREFERQITEAFAKMTPEERAEHDRELEAWDVCVGPEDN